MGQLVVYLSILAFCRMTIGLVFAVSSISKIRNIAQFQETIRLFRILPEWLDETTALIFLGSECVVVLLMLIGGSFLLLGFALAIGLLLLFCLALVLVLARKIETSCNCFGSSKGPVSQVEIWRNFGLLLWASAGIWMFSLTKDMSGGLGLVEWLCVGLGATVFVAIWIQLREAFELFHLE